MKYRALVASGSCRLVVMAIKTGGKWSDEVRPMAQAHTKEVLSFMYQSAAFAWEKRKM